MSVKRYDFNCYAFYDSARLDVQECEDGDYVLHSDYAALLARVARLEEALVSIRDYDSYKHPDEAIIILYEDEIKKAESCTACQYAKKSNWPPSGLCNEHYSSVTKAHDRVTQMFAYKQTWEPREIARRALEEKP